MNYIISKIYYRYSLELLIVVFVNFALLIANEIMNQWEIRKSMYPFKSVLVVYLIIHQATEVVKIHRVHQ